MAACERRGRSTMHRACALYHDCGITRAIIAEQPMLNSTLHSADFYCFMGFSFLNSDWSRKSFDQLVTVVITYLSGDSRQL